MIAHYIAFLLGGFRGLGSGGLSHETGPGYEGNKKKFHASVSATTEPGYGSVHSAPLDQSLGGSTSAMFPIICCSEGE